MTSKEEAINRIHHHIAPEKIHAIYQAGMTDESPLSDFDVVIVTNQPVRVPKFTGKELDFRGIYTVEEFVDQRAFLPYASLCLISGTDIPEESAELQLEETNTIRLAAMFFKSFLRNFYDTRLDSSPKKLLVHLNDFEYALAWCPALPESTKDFLQRIRIARKPHNILTVDCRALRTEAIEQSWEIISLLDNSLRGYFHECTRPQSSVLGTLFVGTPELARLITESHPVAAGRAKILFLPRSFAFLTSPKIHSPLATFARTYLIANTKKPVGILPVCKNILRQSIHAYLKIRESSFLYASSNDSRKPYLIDAFGFLINVFKDYLGSEFVFTLTPEPTAAVQKARWFAPRNFLTLKRLYWSGTIRKYSVVHFNRPESFLQFKKISGQVSAFEIHGFDVGIMGREYLKDLHTAWKRWLGILFDTLLYRRMIQKMQEPDILYVSTPDLVEPVRKWCGRTPEWLPNAIDVSLFSPEGPTKKLVGSPACFLAARLHGDKKPEVAFSLFQKEILPQYPDAVLHLLDTGELAPKYKEILGNDPHYQWHGYMDKPTLASVIRGADLVFGDFSIGALSLLPMQVMAAHRPIVSLDKYEILKEYAHDLPHLTRRLLSDPIFKSHYIARNAQYVHDMHTAESVSARHLANLRAAGLK